MSFLPLRLHAALEGEDLEGEGYLYDMDGQGSAPGSPEVPLQACSDSAPSASGPTPSNSKPGKTKKQKKAPAVVSLSDSTTGR